MRKLVPAKGHSAMVAAAMELELRLHCDNISSSKIVEKIRFELQ